jgi:hypothetical protein
MTPEEAVDFCIPKCGEGYCHYMNGKEPKGWPCLEFICYDCELTFGKVDPNHCKFCKGGLYAPSK